MTKKLNSILLSSILVTGIWLGYTVTLGTASELPPQEQDFVNLVDTVLPGVVSVVGQTQGLTLAQGSGFIVRPDGLVVTNKHVVVDSSLTYDVILNDGTTYLGRVVAQDPINDIALIKIDGFNLPTLQLGDSDEIKIGQTAFAVGNSLGRYQNTVTKGIISGLGRALTASSTGGATEFLDAVIQTDAAINSGNSGGPLFNSRGQVVGMNTAVERGGNGIAFAIPINEISAAIESYEINGEITRPYLGVRFLNIDSDLKAKFNLNYSYGAFLNSGESLEPTILPNSPAAEADLRAGDIVLKINNIKLEGNITLRREIQKYKPGDQIILEIARANNVLTKTVTLGTAPN